MPRPRPSCRGTSASTVQIVVGLCAVALLPAVASFAPAAVHRLPSARCRENNNWRDGASISYRCCTSRLRLSNNGDGEYDPRDNFGRSLRGLQSSALKTSIDVKDTVVCKRSIPEQGIYADASYEVASIYAQSFDEESQQIVKRRLNSLDEPIGAQETVYLSLFSPQYHSDGPVVVTPEEAGLISIRDELGNAAWLAVPGFFWVFVAASFFNTYHERTGGSFGDAFWGR